MQAQSVLQPPELEEFHPITVSTTSDVTEVACTSCEYAQRTGRMDVISHAADHAIATGHTVTETHIRVTVVTGYPS